MQQRQIYTSFDSRWKQVVSKDDIVQAFLDNEWKKGIATQLSGDTVRILLNDTGSVVDVSCTNIQILEKKIKQDQPVPIEVNDFVTFINDKSITAIVTKVQSSISVVVTSQKNFGKECIVSSDKLQFVAKGYSFYDKLQIQRSNDSYTTSNAKNHIGGLMDNKSSPLIKSLNGMKMNSNQQTNQVNQMNSGMALLYPAPCIIKVIPPASEPADFPEAMAIQFPWRVNEPPSILPVIRMGPGTMVVIVPPSYHNNTLMNQGPMQVPIQVPIQGSIQGSMQNTMQNTMQVPIQVPVKAPVQQASV